MDAASDYSKLSAVEIQRTIKTLCERIEDRFSGSGLSNVGRRLLDISDHAAERSLFINRPVYWLRILSIVLVSLLIGLVLDIPWLFDPLRDRLDWVEAVELLEPAMNIVVLIGAMTKPDQAARKNGTDRVGIR